jgi:hypothetical protein
MAALPFPWEVRIRYQVATYHKGDGDYNPGTAHLLSIIGQFAGDIREPSQRDQRKGFHWCSIGFCKFSLFPQ